ncbi:hypothetical protein N9U60_02430 [Betaproteobacteria bacterium]|nr:hypothetical protein [Betaproteobacteria bacterium]
MKKKVIIYLHGFRSSPESTKATFLRQVCSTNDIDFLCPPLDISPEKAIAQAITIVKNIMDDENQQIILIGSSLGGFYATYIMQNCEGAEQLLSILINPSVRPFRDLESAINSEKEWNLEALNIKPFTKNHHLEIQKLEETAGTTLKFPDNILLVAAKGDELLSWEEMSLFYKGCQQYIVDGSDHSMKDFPKHWKSIKSFIGV